MARWAKAEPLMANLAVKLLGLQLLLGEAWIGPTTGGCLRVPFQYRYAWLCEFGPFPESRGEELRGRDRAEVAGTQGSRPLLQG